MTDTPRYALNQVDVTIQLDLENMPNMPVKFSTTELLASQAFVHFTADAGVPIFQDITLTGTIPLKTGGPSKRPQSDKYWRRRDTLPPPVQSVVDYATDRLIGLLT